MLLSWADRSDIVTLCDRLEEALAAISSSDPAFAVMGTTVHRVSTWLAIHPAESNRLPAAVANDWNGVQVPALLAAWARIDPDTAAWANGDAAGRG
jgi:hypothetical protein